MGRAEVLFLENENPALFSDAGELKGRSKGEVQEGKSRQPTGKKQTGVAFRKLSAFFKELMPKCDRADLNG